MLHDILTSDMTAPSLLGLTVVLLLLGVIVPSPTLKEKKKEAERWRLAYEAEREARSKAESHSVELLEVSKATYSIIEAVFGSRRRGIRASQEKPDALP